MNQVIEKLLNILNLQKDVYHDITLIEEEKRGAIMKRAGKSIENLSVMQEKLLTEVDSLERERLRLMDNYRKFALLHQPGNEITLLDIIDSVDGKSAKALSDAGERLKKVLKKLKNVQEVNSVLLRDSMEFYEILLSGLKNSSTIKSGYGSDGRENVKSFNPVLFNIKA